jgi:hypothetical protein
VQINTTGEPTVALSSATAQNPTFTAPNTNTSLTFRFTVEDQGLLSDSETITVQVIRAVQAQYAIVGFGPLDEDSSLQTILILDNPTAENLDDVRVHFLDSSGEPFQVDRRVGEFPLVEPWDEDQPIQLRAFRSIVLEFTSPPEQGVKSGWSFVTSQGVVNGSVRFQIVDETDASLIQDVGILSSPPGSRFQTAYRAKDELALSLANPGTESLSVRLSLFNAGEPEAEPIEAVKLLGAGEQAAFFVSEMISDPGFDAGTLILETETGKDFIATGLITQSGFFISAQSLTRIE